MFYCVLLSAVAMASAFELIRHRFRLIWPSLAVGIAAGAPVAWIGAWMLSRMFPVTLSSEGVAGHSVWGVRCFIRWQDLAAAKRFRVFNLLWLRLYSCQGGAVIWLAMFQSQPVQFKDEIRALAPADSPLLKFLN